MKQIKFSDFKLMKAGDLKTSPCLEILADGQHIGFFIAGAQFEMRDRIKGTASQIDAGKGLKE